MACQITIPPNKWCLYIEANTGSVSPSSTKPIWGQFPRIIEDFRITFSPFIQVNSFTPRDCSDVIIYCPTRLHLEEHCGPLLQAIENPFTKFTLPIAVNCLQCDRGQKNEDRCGWLFVRTEEQLFSSSRLASGDKIFYSPSFFVVVVGGYIFPVRHSMWSL